MGDPLPEPIDAPQAPPELLLRAHALRQGGPVAGTVSTLLERFGLQELTREARATVVRRLAEAGLTAHPSLRMPWVRAGTSVVITPRPASTPAKQAYWLSMGEPVLDWLLPRGEAMPLLILDRPVRLRTGKGDALITPDVRAEVESAGSISATRGRSLAAKALGGALVPGGVFLFGNARSHVHDARELYLVIEGHDWAVAERCDPNMGQTVREFAQTINLQARAAEHEPTEPPTPATRKCPDCAELVLAEAKVCKHCRYRFEAA